MKKYWLLSIYDIKVESYERKELFKVILIILNIYKFKKLNSIYQISIYLSFSNYFNKVFLI